MLRSISPLLHSRLPPFSIKTHFHNRLLTSLQPSKSHLDTFHFVGVLNSCAKSASLVMGQSTHCTTIKLGISFNLFIATALVNMYCKCGSLPLAHKLFDEIPQRNVVSWNSLVSGYSQSDFPEIALWLFKEMILIEVCPSPFSVSSVLAACSALRASELGIAVHCVGLKSGLCFNVVVGTALVGMYAKCYDLDTSRRVFDGMHDRNVVTWTSLINGYVVNQKPNEAMKLVKQMTLSGVKLNAITYTTLLSGLTKFEDLVCGRQIHSMVIRVGLETHPYVSTALTSMYSKCGASEDFVKILPEHSNNDQVLHNSIIAGFSHTGNASEAVDQFLKMRLEGVCVDHFTFASLLRAIAILLASEEGRKTHALVLKTGFDSTLCVQNGLLSMYARCGAIEDSKRVFASIIEPDLISWNSLLSGCAQHGHGTEAVEFFEQMRELMVQPDSTTFLCVLSACGHAGYVTKGLEYFNMMKRQHSCSLLTAPEMEHYACMVDLFGRAGCLNEAESFVNNMPIMPGPSVYRSLLSACKLHKKTDMAIRAAEGLAELCPDDSSTYILLSNVFAEMGQWDNAAMIQKIMGRKGIKKKPGWSRVEG